MDTHDWIFTFQLTVSVTDAGLPVQRSGSNVATITVHVERNQFAPIFFTEAYTATVDETAQLGTSIVTVTATDSDSNVSFLWILVVMFLIKKM